MTAAPVFTKEPVCIVVMQNAPSYWMMSEAMDGELLDPTECMDTDEYLAALNAIDAGDRSVGWRE